jgi:5'(3')-deoxyribonucleotidase
VNIEYLIFDFDGTIVDTISAFCKTYNQMLYGHKDFIAADPTQVYDYGFRDQCPLIDNIQDIFASQEFFENLQPMHGALRELKQLSIDFPVMICTKGHNLNISLKSKYIEENMGFVKDVIYMNTEDKRRINMANCVFCDDHIDNLMNSNATISIAYGEKFPWNEKWTGLRIPNWAVIRPFLKELTHNN